MIICTNKPHCWSIICALMCRFPAELKGVILGFAVHSDAERDNDERIVERLVPQLEIDTALRTVLKYGVHEGWEQAPYLETSAQRGNNADRERGRRRSVGCYNAIIISREQE